MAKIEQVIKPAKEKKAPPPPAPTTEPEPPAPTPEELEARQKAVIESMGWKGLVESDKPQAAPAPTPEPQPEHPKPAPKPEPAPQAKPSPAPTPAPALAVSKQDIEDAAQRAAKLVADQRPPAPAPVPVAAPAPAPAMDMSAEDRKDLEVISFLERTEPAKYAGRTEKFMSYTRAYYAYQDEWAARPENEGKDFDPDDHEHNSWFSKHDAGTTDEELEDGRHKMLRASVKKEVLEEIKPELEREREQRLAQERQQALEKAQPVIRANINRQTLEVIETVSPELAQQFRDKDGNPLFTDEAKAAAAALDPIAKQQLETIIREQLEPQLWSLELVAVDPTAVKNLHPLVVQQIWKTERELLAASVEDRIREGKEFITFGQREQMRESIENSNATDKEAQIKQLDEKFWVLTVDDIERLVVTDIAKDAAQRIQEADELAKRKYQPAGGSGRSNAQPAQSSGGKPRPPVASSGGDTARTSDQLPPEKKKFAETMAAVMYKGPS